MEENLSKPQPLFALAVLAFFLGILFSLKALVG
jgi:hypothetical protein